MKKLGNNNPFRKIQVASIVIIMIGWLLWSTQPFLEKIGGSIIVAGFIGIVLADLLNKH